MSPGLRSLILGGLLLVASGCSQGVNVSYGRSRGTSINGTGVLAGLLRDQGHPVRSAVRLSDELGLWAEVIVRFAPYPGAPSRDEAEWYGRWLDADGSRRLIYVPYDYEASHDYWVRAKEQLPANTDARTRERIEAELARAANWALFLPAYRKEPAAVDEWFAVSSSQGKGTSVRTPVVCKKLGGPWAQGVDPVKAALIRDDTLVAESETVLLTGDGRPLAMMWTRPNDSRVLVVANGSFLLNAAIATHPARAPLTEKVVRWVSNPVSPNDGNTSDRVVPSAWPRRVAFVEGHWVTSEAAGPPSVFALLGVEPFGIVAAQLFVLGLAGCLARAPRLGRARPDEPTDAERPVSHPEALGALLARTRQAREARSVLEVYRRWRTAPGSRGPT